MLFIKSFSFAPDNFRIRISFIFFVSTFTAEADNLNQIKAKLPNRISLPLNTWEQTSHGVIFLYVYSWKLWASGSPLSNSLVAAAPFFLGEKIGSVTKMPVLHSYGGRCTHTSTRFRNMTPRRRRKRKLTKCVNKLFLWVTSVFKINTIRFSSGQFSFLVTFKKSWWEWWWWFTSSSQCEYTPFFNISTKI